MYIYIYIYTHTHTYTHIHYKDCHGFGFDDVRFDAILALNRLVENRNLIMPETITRILVIRAPNAWVHAWSMFKHIMDPGIAGKVEIAGSDTLELLRRYIDDSEIPAYLGGRPQKQMIILLFVYPNMFV